MAPSLTMALVAGGWWPRRWRCMRSLFLDASGRDVLAQLQKTIASRGGRQMLAGRNAPPREVMERSGFLAQVDTLLK